MYKLIYLISLISVSFLHCDNPESNNSEPSCPNAESYEMKNFSDLAGCSWMLVKGDQTYEVVNLGEYYDSFGTDVNVKVEIRTLEDMMSNCQAGIISEIVCKE